MKIGVFGGTFDPPHLGHQAVVSEVLRQGIADEVWYLPVAVHDPQFCKPWMSQAVHRVQMLSIQESWHRERGEAVRIERFELDEQLEGFTHRTLRELAHRYPEHSFSFILGSDQLEKLHLWGCDQEAACFPQVLTEFTWYVYPRGGAPVRELPYAELQLIEHVQPVSISSTLVRTRVAQGAGITDCVLAGVASYIAEHQLYTGIR